MTQHDEVIWQVINHNNCCFKVKTKSKNLCRNLYNVTGICNRSSCPLANSQYATVKEKDGRCYLLIKTIEMAHMPKKHWQKISLDSNYIKALNEIDEHLEFWPKYLVHKNKQRLTKIMQYHLRVQKNYAKTKPGLKSISIKHRRRDSDREAKSEVAAHLEQTIEKELIARFYSGIYGNIYNTTEIHSAATHRSKSLKLNDKDNLKVIDGHFEDKESGGGIDVEYLDEMNEIDVRKKMIAFIFLI